MCGQAAATEPAPGRWTAERAWAWYRQQPWIVGFNFVPSTAGNTTEFWAEETFDAATIDREMGMGAGLGFNSCRVFVQYLVWKQDPEGLKRRIDRFLTLAAGHGIRTTMVLFDDCAFGDPPVTEPYPGRQRDPIPGMVLSNWTPSPGLKAVTDTNAWPDLEKYVKDIVGAFGRDQRVLLWDLYNEPGNSRMGNKSLPLVEATFAWARAANPTQPLTIGVWGAPPEISRRQIDWSDVVSFHFYGDCEGLRRRIADMKAHGRPVINTEWMARPRGSRWDTDLPLFKREAVGCYNWGLVNGRTQCQFAWNDKRGTPEPAVWFHDLFHRDGRPYDPAEHAAIRRTTADKSIDWSAADFTKPQTKPGVAPPLVAGATLRGPVGAAEVAPTFCNPLNLDYGWSGPDQRHGADPVVVLFKDKYYLFSTWDVPGFRVSDDLLHWTSHVFPGAVAPLMTSDTKGYCAPAVAARGDWLYFINMTPRKADKQASVMRTRDPLSGAWEKCGGIRKVGDPDLFFDDDGRAWLYHGLGHPTKVFELDTNTWTEVPGSEVQLRTAITNTADFAGGYERGRREIFAETDTGAFLDSFKMLPCQEAAWMTKRDGRYYLQYSTPGTVSQWYCDVALEGRAPTGPFQPADYSPVSMKIGGFMGSAGHSCVFQDKQGRWWRATTMWIGVRDLFERRLGLFPVGFDAEGRMYTGTALGDYPQRLDGGPAGWWVQSYGKACTASSSQTNHAPELAADENCRTWWSAQSGDAGEWFRMDLGKPCRVNAVQVNFAEQDCATWANDGHQYKLLGSADGREWQTLLDRSANRTAVPHDYLALAELATLRFLKVENLHVPAGGRFALRDLRVFGHGGGTPPAPVAAPQVTRHADDRNATVRWLPVGGADGYLLRYGIAADKLWQCIQLQGGATSNLTFHALTRGARYAWRVDAFNDSGLTPGEPTAVP